MPDFQKFTLLLFGCVCPFFLRGQQTFDIQWSEPLTMTSSTLPVYARADSSGILVLRLEGEIWTPNFDYSPGSPPVVQTFTPDLKLISAGTLKDWSSEGEGNIAIRPRFFSFGKKNWILRAQADGHDSVRQRLIVQEVDLNEKPAKREPVVLHDWITSTHLFAGASVIRTDMFGSKLAVAYFPDAKRNHFVIKVFNRRWELMWKKEVSLPFEEGLFELRDFLLSRTGAFYCEARLYDALPDKVEDPRNVTLSTRKEYASYSSMLLAFSAQSDNADLIKLDLPKGSFRETLLTEDSSGVVHCFGFYSEKNYEQFDGWADINFDPVANTVNLKGPHPFPAEVLSRVSLEKDGKTGKMPAFAIRDFKWRPNNTFEVFGEYAHEKSVLHIVGFRIDSSLQKAQGIRIQKSQTWSNEQELNWTSAKAISYPDETLVVYNSDLEKTERAVKIFSWPLNGEPKEHVVSEPDNSTRKSGFFVAPQSIRQVDKDRFILLVEAKNRKKHWIGLVTRK